jgi:hypothetical protein
VELTSRCDERDDVSQCLRAAVGAANFGHGDLFISASPVDLSDVAQHIFDSEGSVRDEPIIGEFEHHPAHHHIHFGGWAYLALRKIEPRCEHFSSAENCPIARQGEKISFCLRNSVQEDPAFTPNRLYDCVLAENGRVEQGISAGYMDVYTSEYFGQMIDVTGLESGEYWLETVVNPERVALEANYENNVARGRVSIELPRCGDGSIDFPESCEGQDLGEMECRSVDDRFVGGELACNATCGWDRTRCERAECEPIDVGSGVGVLGEGSNRDAWDTTEPQNCQTPAGTGRDVAFQWAAPSSGRFHFVDRLGGMMVSVRDGDCSGAELACIVERTARGVDVEVVQGQVLVVVLDVLPGGERDYALEASGPL